MKRILAHSTSILLVALTIGIVVSGSSSAQIQSQETELRVEPIDFSEGSSIVAGMRVLTEDEALARDAAEYADEFGVSQEEAELRIKLLEDVGKLNAKLETEEVATFSGLYVVHQPEFRIVARFKDEGQRILETYISGSSLAGRVEADTAEATYADLKETQIRAIRTLQAAQFEDFDSSLNVSENRIELRVVDGRTLQRVLAASNAQLPDKVVVIETPQLLQMMVDGESYAGRRIFREGYYDGTRAVCTSGFSVREYHSNGSFTEGVTTAGHCSGTSRYNYISTTPLYYESGAQVELPREGRRFYQSWDVQWHRTPGYDDRALFYDGSGDLRRVDGLKRRTETFQGDRVCDYGRVSGESCSTVKSKNSSFSDIPNSEPTFIVTGRLMSNSREPLALPGDSGGPVYSQNDAAGIISFGGSYSNPDEYIMGYMAIGYVEDMDVRVQVWGQV